MAVDVAYDDRRGRGEVSLRRTHPFDSALRMACSPVVRSRAPSCSK
jgi:hypothetical protein